MGNLILIEGVVIDTQMLIVRLIQKKRSLRRKLYHPNNNLISTSFDSRWVCRTLMVTCRLRIFFTGLEWWSDMPYFKPIRHGKMMSFTRGVIPFEMVGHGPKLKLGAQTCNLLVFPLRVRRANSSSITSSIYSTSVPSTLEVVDLNLQLSVPLASVEWSLVRPIHFVFSQYKSFFFYRYSLKDSL